MNPFAFFRRPEYFFRPSQVIRRFGRIGYEPHSMEEVRLPWGAKIRVRTSENVGSDIYYYGIFDRIVPETIWRLLDPGEVAVDIGANIGQNTSAMAFRSGLKGRTFAFEPHPEIFAELQENCRAWPHGRIGEILLKPVALGSQEAEGLIIDGPEFSTNRGSAFIRDTSLEAVTGRQFSVKVETLDSYFCDTAPIGLCKIDVEGHELSVLKGATNLFSRKVVRDLIFEDFSSMPSAAAQFLLSFGFSIFQLKSRWLKPALAPIAQMEVSKDGFTHNYLATLAPSRAIQRFRIPGWRCLMDF